MTHGSRDVAVKKKLRHARRLKVAARYRASPWLSRHLVRLWLFNVRSSISCALCGHLWRAARLGAAGSYAVPRHQRRISVLLSARELVRTMRVEVVSARKVPAGVGRLVLSRAAELFTTCRANLTSPQRTVSDNLWGTGAAGAAGRATPGANTHRSSSRAAPSAG